MSTYILGASKIDNYDFYKNLIKDEDFVICADGGTVHAKKLGIIPDVVIGDFDSSSDMEEYKNKIVYPREKDDTDLFIAIKYAHEKGIKECIVIGGLGERLDHTYTNLSLFLYGSKNNMKITYLSEKEKIFCVYDKEVFYNEGYKYVSVFSLTEMSRGVSYKGLKYSLDNYDMSADNPIGVSNEFVSECAEISVKNGVLMVMLIS